MFVTVVTSRALMIRIRYARLFLINALYKLRPNGKLKKVPNGSTTLVKTFWIPVFIGSPRRASICSPLAASRCNEGDAHRKIRSIGLSTRVPRWNFHHRLPSILLKIFSVIFFPTLLNHWAISFISSRHGSEVFVRTCVL